VIPILYLMPNGRWLTTKAQRHQGFRREKPSDTFIDLGSGVFVVLTQKRRAERNQDDTERMAGRDYHWKPLLTKFGVWQRVQREVVAFASREAVRGGEADHGGVVGAERQRRG